jgi:hypothetical protein
MGSLLKIIVTVVLVYWIIGVLVDAGFDVHIYPDDWEIIFGWAAKLLAELRDSAITVFNYFADALHENIGMLF